MRLNRLAIISLCILGSCNDPDGSPGFAPTGAKGKTDEFGNVVYVDEECGGRDDAIYSETFQNALFRDGAVYQDRLWLVDGSHVWAADKLAVTPEALQTGLGVPTPRVILPFVGHANAVTAGDNFVAFALVDRGVLVLPDGDASRPIWIQETARAMDVAARGNLLAVGAGADGVQVYDLGNASNPLPLFSSPATGYVAGVEWSKNSPEPLLYYAACSQIGRFDFKNGFRDYAWASTAVSHRNAKDIAAIGHYVFVANNGEGLWFYNSKLRFLRNRDNPDPNFYANAVALDGRTVYLAAGNRELAAYRFAGAPLTTVPKDPVGVLAYNDMLYGFGNFREVGERTVVRAPTIDSSSIEEFERGSMDLVEPYYLQPAKAFTQQGKTVYRISTFVDGAPRVYERMLTDAAWRLLPGVLYYGNAGTYAVEVTTDNVIRVYPPGITEPVFSEFIMDTPIPYQWVWNIRTFDTGFIFSISMGAISQNTLYEPGRGSSWDSRSIGQWGLDQEREISISYVGYPGNNKPLDLDWTVFSTDAGPSHKLIVGARESDDGPVAWISSQFPVLLPEGQDISGEKVESTRVGALISGCRYCNARIQEGGLVDVLPTEEGAILMFDERRANVTAIVILDQKAHETKRWIHFGRPSGLTEEGLLVRAWFADGSSFRFDPTGPLVRRDEFEAVIR